ncbi:MAG: hypothetical protein MJZ08_08935 [Bacteroidaceae bacterium]|nr:hypothetical protein [Bacteroidaceae bacterium]
MALLLETQYDYYKTHEAELLKQYQGKHLVISDMLQVYPFLSPKEGYQFGIKNFGAGHFLLHKCEPGSLNVVHTINSCVAV